jgi:hypothetical protein
MYKKGYHLEILEMFCHCSTKSPERFRCGNLPQSYRQADSLLRSQSYRQLNSLLPSQSNGQAYSLVNRHRVESQSQSHFTTDSQSVCLSWCRAPSGAHDQMFILVWKLQSCPYGAPSLTRGRVCHLSVIVDSKSLLVYTNTYKFTIIF